MPHEFLSDEWFTAVEALTPPEPPANSQGVALNVVVTREGADNVSISLADGRMERGLKEGAPTTVTTPFSVAKALFINQDQAAAMQAFMSGQIKVSGDITKLMALGQQAPSVEQEAYAGQIQALTVQ
jgi:putative sterol carrier protein